MGLKIQFDWIGLDYTKFKFVEKFYGNRGIGMSGIWCRFVAERRCNKLFDKFSYNKIRLVVV